MTKPQIISDINKKSLRIKSILKKKLNKVNYKNLNIVIGDTIENFHFSGALGQTRTGTPKRARILSPLCLPISPRGHVVNFVVIVNILIHKCFK